MRILMVSPGPNFSVADVEHGWTRALERQGHEVRTYNLDDRLTFFSTARWGDHTLSTEEAVRLAVEPLGNTCYRYWPDVIIVVSGFFIPTDLWQTWKRRPHKTVLLCTESPYEDLRQFEQMMTGEPDVVLLNDPVNLHAYAAHHDKVAYVPHAYDPDVHFPGPDERDIDFAFVGTGYRSRYDFFARVDWPCKPVLAGYWQQVAGTVLEPFVSMHPITECYDNSKAADLYRSTKVSANLYRARDGGNEAHDPRLAEGWSVGPREIELAATGTFFLREPRGEGGELFPFLPTFTEPDEFADKLRYYLVHDEERQSLALRAISAVADRTFDANARRLMQLLDA